MRKIIDIHTNILYEKSTIQNPRIKELFLKIKPNSIKKTNLIKEKTLKINTKANFKDLLLSMKKNNITHSVCFSYQWSKHTDCIKSNDFIIDNITKRNITNLSCLVVVEPKKKNAVYDLEKYLKLNSVIGLKIKPSWCNTKLSDLKYMGPICEELIKNKKMLLTHISQGFHPNMGDNLYELIQLLKNFPKLKVVAAHMGGGICLYNNYKPLEKLFKNLYIDISLPSQIEWLPFLIDKFDTSKFLFASDFPYLEQKKVLLEILNLNLEENKLNALFYDNARNLINSCRKKPITL